MLHMAWGAIFEVLYRSDYRARRPGTHAPLGHSLLKLLRSVLGWALQNHDAARTREAYVAPLAVAAGRTGSHCLNQCDLYSSFHLRSASSVLATCLSGFKSV